MTWYLLCMGGALVLCTLVYLLRNRSLSLSLLSLVLMTVLGFVMAKLMYVLPMINVVLHKYGAAGLVHMDIEEFSLWGGVAGVCMGVALAAKLEGRNPGEALDRFAPAGALLLACARASEYFLNSSFIHQGMIGLGNEIEEGVWYCCFPFAVVDEWGMWYEAIFMMETVIALVAVVLALTAYRNHCTFLRTLFFVMAGQLYTEMLHCQSISWGFVHVEQIYCAVVMLVILFIHGRHAVVPRGAFRPCLYALGLYGVVVFLEFELDKSWISGLLWENGSDFAISLAAFDATFCYTMLMLIVILLLVLEQRAVINRVFTQYKKQKM